MTTPNPGTAELEELRDFVMANSNTTGYPHCVVYLEHEGDDTAFLGALSTYISQREQQAKQEFAKQIKDRFIDSSIELGELHNDLPRKFHWNSEDIRGMIDALLAQEGEL